MGDRIARMLSLDATAKRVLSQLNQGHHAVLVGSPGCGTTTFLDELIGQIDKAGFEVVRFDADKQEPGTILAEANKLSRASERPRVVVIDHAAKRLADERSSLLQNVHECANQTGSLCLCCGCLDARALDKSLHVKICSVPAAHVSFPLLARDELLAAYRTIAENCDCRWGEAILYLMLDLCGSDLALCASATRYFPGDWSQRLYDETVWDRIKEWMENDRVVDGYRKRLKSLSEECNATLALVRFGGKPTCARTEIVEEVNDALRQLCLNGFLVQNLLPGFYQLRNLVVRYLLDESIPPELLFRRAANERAAQLLQDAETMLRQVLAWVFDRQGLEAVRERLLKMQQPGELIAAELNRDILKWARESSSEADFARLNKLILEHRESFKAAKSVWASVTNLMKEDGVEDDGQLHLHSIEYLTLNDLGTLVTERIDEILPNVADNHKKTRLKKQLKDRWEEGVAKVRRLRNKVAHLRNVDFQDMEDLVGTLETMRHDVIKFGGWKSGL